MFRLSERTLIFSIVFLWLTFEGCSKDRVELTHKIQLNTQHAMDLWLKDHPWDTAVGELYRDEIVEEIVQNELKQRGFE